MPIRNESEAMIRKAFMQALAWYEHNTHKDIIVRDILGDDHHETYLEKYERLLIDSGLFVVYGKLDYDHKKKLDDIIESRYGIASRNWVAREDEWEKKNGKEVNDD